MSAWVTVAETGQRFLLADTATTLGREGSAQVHLEDESISRRHAQIQLENGRVWVEDLKSLNGTYVNGERVTRHPLADGDRLRLGRLDLIVHLLQEEDRRGFARDTVRLDAARTGPVKGLSSQGSARSLEGLVDLILEMAVLTETGAILTKALRKLQAVLPTAARGAILELRKEGAHRIHPASWIRGSEARLESVREDAIARFSAAGEKLLLPPASPADPGVIVVPIRSRGRLTGLLYLEAHPGGSFAEPDLRLAAAATMAITIGLDNSLLYAELLASLEFNEGILQGLGSGLMALDADGFVRKINAVGVELLGLSAGDILRHDLREISILAPLVPYFRRLRETGERVDRLELDLRRGAEAVPFGFTLVPLRDPAGEVDGAIANFRDLIQVRRLADLVRRGQRLAALGEMAAGVAHEIRNPLNSIRGFVQLILEHTQGEDRRYMGIVLDEVERINHIVTGLLDFGRQQELAMGAVALSEVALRAVALVAQAAERRHVRLRNTVDGACRVLGNAAKLEQVFLNLMQNAVEAAPDGGEVSIAAVPREEAGARGWSVAVADDGPGIATEDQEKLFTPFFTRKDRGTGLGLAICHKIVESHGGRIEVDSRVGAGTTFRVWLPEA